MKLTRPPRTAALNKPHTAIFIIFMSMVSSLVVGAEAAPVLLVPSIPTEGGSWTSPNITVLITPQHGQPWYKDTYAFDANHAINRWAQSVIAYTDSYGSDYLRKLSFTTCVFGVNDTICGNPDIEIKFIESFGSQSAGLGLTSLRITNSGIFSAPTTTTLATYDPSNTTQLSDTDMINIASHEFGHALGLNHATVSGANDGTSELMYRGYSQPVGSLADSLEAPSTLDLYALSYVYDWLGTSSTLNGPGHPVTEIVLPSETAYSSVYPYIEQVQMLRDAANRTRLEIIVLAIIVALLLALVFVFGILLSRRKSAPPQIIAWQPAEPLAPG